jgi:hypothetical protein
LGFTEGNPSDSLFSQTRETLPQQSKIRYTKTGKGRRDETTTANPNRDLLSFGAVPEEEWIEVRSTHEPLIDEETFALDAE